MNSVVTWYPIFRVGVESVTVGRDSDEGHRILCARSAAAPMSKINPDHTLHIQRCYIYFAKKPLHASHSGSVHFTQKKPWHSTIECGGCGLDWFCSWEQQRSLRTRYGAVMRSLLMLRFAAPDGVHSLKHCFSPYLPPRDAFKKIQLAPGSHLLDQHCHYAINDKRNFTFCRAPFWSVSAFSCTQEDDWL
jgi:hypothetical protein